MMATTLGELIEFIEDNASVRNVKASYLALNDAGDIEVPSSSGKLHPMQVSENALRQLCKLNGINWPYFRRIPMELKQANLNWFLDRSKANYELHLMDNDGVQTVSEVHDADSDRSVQYILRLVADNMDESYNVVQPSITVDNVALYIYDKDTEADTPFGTMCKGLIVWAPADKNQSISASPVLVSPVTETVIEFNIDSKRSDEIEEDASDSDIIQYAKQNMAYIDQILSVGLDSELESVEHFFQHDAQQYGVRGKLNKMAYDNCMMATSPIELATNLMQTEEQLSEQLDFMKIAKLAGKALHPSTPVFCSHCHQVIDEGDN